MNPCRLLLEASGILRMRIRPIRRPSSWAAMTTNALASAARPGTPSSSPPTYVSSTSTPRQPVSSGPNHRPPKLVQPGPSGLIAAQTQNPLHPQGARPVLLAGHPPGRSKPHRQRLTRVLEDRPGRDRNLVIAPGTLPQNLPHRPSSIPAAPRANEALRPPQAEQIVPASLLRAKPIFQFSDCPGIVFHERLHYRWGLPESSGYPLFGPFPRAFARG